MRFRHELKTFIQNRGGNAEVAYKGHVDKSYLTRLAAGDPKYNGPRRETLQSILDNNYASEIEEFRLMWAAGYVPDAVKNMEITTLVYNILMAMEAAQIGSQPIYESEPHS